jgi:hypothetical protein
MSGRPAEDLEQLAAKLGRPSAGLSELGRLTPSQIRFLSDAIDAACERERRSVDTALGRVIPRPVLRVVLRTLRR